MNKLKGILENNKKRAQEAALKILNKQFFYLTVIEVLNKGKLRCRCSCGKEKILWRSDVLSGKTTSCGCMRKAKQGLSFIEKKDKMFLWKD